MEDLLNQIGGPLVMVVSALLVAGGRKIITVIPPMFLPTVAGGFGLLVDLAIAQIGLIDSMGWQAAAWGFAATALYETKKGLMKALSPPPPAPKPEG